AEASGAAIMDGALALHIVTHEDLLVAQVKLAVQDDRMRPDLALGMAVRALWVQLEASLLHELLGIDLHEGEGAVILVEGVEMPVGDVDRPFQGELILHVPHDLTGLPVLTDQALGIGEPVEVIPDLDDPAVVVDHVLVLPDIAGLVVLADADELAADPVARGDVNLVALHDGRRDDGDLALPGRGPDKLPVLGGHADDLILEELHILSDTVDLCDENGGVFRLAGLQLLGLPD